MVEFQKRGLPHTYTLIWLKDISHEPSASLIDSLISAEIPNPLIGDYNEACQLLDDNERLKLFEEAIVWATPFQLRHLFMSVLMHCEVTNGRALFDRYWPSMAEDISYRLSLVFGNAPYELPQEIFKVSCWTSYLPCFLRMVSHWLLLILLLDVCL